MIHVIFLAALLLVATPGWSADPAELTNPDGRAMRFKLYRPCLDDTVQCAPRVFAQGRIDEATGEALHHFVAQERLANPRLPGELIICIDSGRGDVAAAMRLGAAIRALNLTTCVETRYDEETGDRQTGGVQRQSVLADEPLCTSVCVLALAGGVKRYVAVGAKVALRHFSELEESMPGTSKIATAALADYLRQNGVDPSLLDIALIAPRDDARFLSQDDVAFYRIATHDAQSSLLQAR